MLTTPAQARELWCPMVRIARDESITTSTPAGAGLEVVKEQRFIVGGCNSDALGKTRVPASCRCIADQCAMWRWVPSATTHKEPRVVDRPFGGREVVHVDVPDATTHGFCGLAGRPEVAP